MIPERVQEYRSKKAQLWPVRSNRASELGHACERYLVYIRTRGEEQSLPSPELQAIFDLGNVFEGYALKELSEAGFVVVEQQRAWEWKEYAITGHYDGLLVENGSKYPLEIKSSSPFVFNGLDGIDSLKRGKYHYLRKYPAQLTLYLLMAGLERGLFLFVNKVTGAMKEIWMDLDYDLGESLLQKAGRINAHVEAGTIPDPIEYDESVCGDCAFQHICLPDRIGTEVKIIDSAELAGLIDRWNILKPMAKEYDDLDAEIKKAVEGEEKVLAGDWFITRSWRKTTKYDIPSDIKKAYQKESGYWVTKIVKVGQ